MVAPLTYDAPTSNETLNTDLQNNQALAANAAVLATVQQLLNIDPANPTGNTPIQYYTGQEPIQLVDGQAPQMLVIANQTIGNLEITQDVLGDFADTIKYYSFDAVGADPNVIFTAALGDPVIASGDGDDKYVLDGTEESITILGGGGEDTISTGSADDSISGDEGDDEIYAFAGNDSILSTQGHDTIDGGDGWDIVTMNGLVQNWSFGNGSAHFQTTNSIVDVTNVEFVGGFQTQGQIANPDGSSFLGGQQNSFVIVDNVDDLLVSRLYQALLNRSADADGVQYWQDEVASDESLATLANAFLVSDEFQAQWGDLTTDDYVNLVYRNAFERDATQNELDTWSDLIDHNQISEAQFAVVIVGTADNIDNVLLVDHPPA